jgi:transcriptional regulator with XRE-family HTH domain
MMAFAQNLRQLRLERFLSQAELARLARMHAITITRLEAGEQAPSTRTVRSLAEALAVEPRALAAPDEVAAARMLGRRRTRVPRDPSGRSHGAAAAAAVAS